MKNKSKIGTEFENVLKNFLLGQYNFDLVIRSAGSKSPIDLVAFREDNILPHFIQCKSTTIPNKMPITVNINKKYQTFENIKVKSVKILAFYNFKENLLSLFLLTNSKWLNFFSDKIPEKYLYKK